MAERICVRDDPLLGVLVIVLAVLGGFAIWAGLFWQGAAVPLAEVASVRGEAVALDGRGAYRFNPVFQAATYRAQDMVMAAALLLALWAALAMRGGQALALLLAALGYAVYGHASVALSAALDWLFAAHVVLFALAWLALWRAGLSAVAAFDRPGLPRRGLAAFLLVAGVGTVAVWAPPLLSDLAAGQAPPRLGTQTTEVTHALDLAVIVPLCLVAAWLVWRGRALGHVLALPLIGCLLLLLPTIALATVLQMRAGIELDLPEWLGPVGAFAVLGVVAAVFLRAYLRALRPLA